MSTATTDAAGAAKAQATQDVDKATDAANKVADAKGVSKDTGDEDTRPRHEQGKENSHNVLDRKDEKTNANTIDEMKKEGQKAEQKDEARKAELKHDPTLAAREHGNEPSRGAKKDKELVDEEEEIIRKMDEAKAQSKEAHKH